MSDHDIRRELAVIASSCRAAAVSPWVDIDAEVRLVLLDGVVLLAFCKKRTENADEPEWRHNLRFGAFPAIVEPANVPVTLSNCARSAAAMLGLRFAAVDLVSSEDSGKSWKSIAGSAWSASVQPLAAIMSWPKRCTHVHSQPCSREGDP